MNIDFHTEKPCFIKPVFLFEGVGVEGYDRHFKNSLYKNMDTFL